jgi:hypothetical protein
MLSTLPVCAEHDHDPEARVASLPPVKVAVTVATPSAEQSIVVMAEDASDMLLSSSNTLSGHWMVKVAEPDLIGSLDEESLPPHPWMDIRIQKVIIKNTAP